MSRRLDRDIPSEQKHDRGDGSDRDLPRGGRGAAKNRPPCQQPSRVYCLPGSALPFPCPLLTPKRGLERQTGASEDFF
jgi:hypothetical protein